MNPIAQAELTRAGELYGLSADEILEHKRGKSRDEARAIAAWVLRKRYEFSYPEIGRYLNRDHTSIMPAVKRVERELAERSDSLFARNAVAVMMLGATGNRATRQPFQRGCQ